MKFRKLLALLVLATVVACASKSTTTEDQPKAYDASSPANFTVRAQNASELEQLGEKPSDYETAFEKHEGGIWIDERLKVGTSTVALLTKKNTKGITATELINTETVAVTIPTSVTQKMEQQITLDTSSAKRTAVMRCDIQSVENNSKVMSCPVISSEPAEMDKVTVAYSFFESCFIANLETVVKNEVYGVLVINGQSFKAKKVQTVKKGHISCSGEEQGIGHETVVRIFAIDLPVMFPMTRYANADNETYNYTEYKLPTGEILNSKLYETLQFRE